MSDLILYEIWIEGWYATGGHSPARLLGREYAESFGGACVLFVRNNPEYRQHFNLDKLSHWGCSLFDNEVEARAVFG